MKHLTILCLLFTMLLSSGVSYCSRDIYEGATPRLLAKMQGEPDIRYRSQIDVFLGSGKDHAITVDINTSHKWYIENITQIPLWCAVSLPSGIIGGFVTDKTLTFTTRWENKEAAVRSFTLVLRHILDPMLRVTINVNQRGQGDGLEIEDLSPYTQIAQYKNQGHIFLPGLGPNENDPQVFKFKVLTDHSWTLKMSPDKTNMNEPLNSWMSVQIDGGALAQASGNELLLSGQGEATLIMSVQPNASTRYARYANMSIQSTAAQILVPIVQQTQTAYLDISQNNVPVTSLSLEAYDMAQADRSIIKTLQFTSNRNWEIESIQYEPSNVGNWLSLTPSFGSLNQAYGQSDDQVILTAAQNAALSSRKATVTFKGSYMRGTEVVTDLSRTLVVTQAAFMPVYPADNIIVPQFAGTNARTFSLSFPCNYAFSIEGGGEGFSVETLSFNAGTQQWDMTVRAADNPDENKGRSAVFTIAAVNEAYAAYNKNISVSQDKKWWVRLISPTNGNMSFGSGSTSWTPPNTRPPTSQDITFSAYLGDGATWTATISSMSNINQFSPASGSPQTLNNANSITIQPIYYVLAGTISRTWSVNIVVTHADMHSGFSFSIAVKQ